MVCLCRLLLSSGLLVLCFLFYSTQCQFKVSCLLGYKRWSFALLFREKEMSLGLDTQKTQYFHPNLNLFFKLQQNSFVTICTNGKQTNKTLYY